MQAPSRTHVRSVSSGGIHAPCGILSARSWRQGGIGKLDLSEAARGKTGCRKRLQTTKILFRQCRKHPGRMRELRKIRVSLKKRVMSPHSGLPRHRRKTLARRVLPLLRPANRPGSLPLAARTLKIMLPSPPRTHRLHLRLNMLAIRMRLGATARAARQPHRVRAAFTCRGGHSWCWSALWRLPRLGLWR